MSIKKNSRRAFVKKAAMATAGLSILPNLTYGSSLGFGKDKLKLAFIGVGLRGTNHLNNALQRKDVEIAAICDVDSNRIDIALNHIKKAGFATPKVFGKSDYDYRNLLDLKEVDAVIIATPWLWHVKMAVDSMKAGKYTGVEVSAANTLEECWDLVNTHEETGSHLMILENVNYRRDVMAVLNMVKQNVFGELLHFRCGYQHDLRGVKFNDGKSVYGKGVEFGEKGISESAWRTQHSLLRNADVYPTHGLGPVAVMADVNRGNRFVSLTSHATRNSIKVSEFLSEDRLNQVAADTKVGGATLTKLLGTSAWYAPGAAVSGLVQAIACDQKKIFPCSTLLDGEYGLSDLCIGVPVILGRNGIEQIVDVPLSDAEKAHMAESAEGVKKTNGLLEL